MLDKRPRARDIAYVVHRYLSEAGQDPAINTGDYEFKIARNLLHILLRDLEQSPWQQRTERDWLASELQWPSGELLELRREFRARILTGQIAFDSEAVQHYLWVSTCDALEIDNPRYAAYRTFIESRGDRPHWSRA